MGSLANVEQFHRKYGFQVGVDVKQRTAFEDQNYLHHIAYSLKAISDSALSRIKGSPCAIPDDRLQRMQLMIEELAELGLGLLRRDEILVADAVTDLHYTVCGTAVTYGMPLKELHEEVHASNMTKDVDGQHKPRKGESFRSPDIKKVLETHGERQTPRQVVALPVHQRDASGAIIRASGVSEESAPVEDQGSYQSQGT